MAVKSAYKIYHEQKLKASKDEYFVRVTHTLVEACVSITHHISHSKQPTKTVSVNQTEPKWRITPFITVVYLPIPPGFEI